jgi:S-DNA-T family DNA segregation ATPase FtsK/SpoIIIE
MDDIDHGRTSQCFAALVAQGPAVGMSFVSTTAEAEIGRLAAATEGYGLGVPNPRAHVPMTRVGSARPGRGTRLRDGAMLQVASASPDPGVVRPPANRVDRIVIRTLPYRVVLEEIAASDGGFVIGVGGDSAAPVRVDLIAGSARMLVAGPPSSGKSTALLSLLVQALARSVPVCVAAADRSPLTLAARAHGLHVLLPHDRCPEIDCAGGIVLIDDVDRFVDSPAADALTTVIRSASRAAAVVASGDATELSILQRSPIVELRRGRTGLLLQPRAVDAELVGLRLPRSVPTHVPGRGLLVAGTELLPGPARDPLPVQVAIPTPAPDRAVVNPYAGSGGRSAGRTSP